MEGWLQEIGGLEEREDKKKESRRVSAKGRGGKQGALFFNTTDFIVAR